MSIFAWAVVLVLLVVAALIVIWCVLFLIRVYLVVRIVLYSLGAIRPGRYW